MSRVGDFWRNLLASRSPSHMAIWGKKPTFADMQPVLSAAHLLIGYRHTPIAPPLSADLLPGKLTCLLGPNGSGKSTLLRTLAGMQLPLAGSLLLRGKPIATYTPRELALHIAVVLTERPAAAAALTVSELVALGRAPHTGFFGRLGTADRRLVQRAMQRVGIDTKGDEPLDALSDGERQKAMIARALAQQTPVILLDEPTAFLDAPSRILLMQLLRQLAHEHNLAILLSTHDIHLAVALADRLWLVGHTQDSCPQGDTLPRPDQGSARHQPLSPAALIQGTTRELVLSGTLDTLFPGAALPFPSFQQSFR